MTYNPWEDAATRYPDVHIEWQALGGTAHALWAPNERVILIDRFLTKAERRCALAHEIAHIDTGDRATDLCWFSNRQESNADKLAARRLISVKDLAEVMRWTNRTGEAAEALDVTLAVMELRAHTFCQSERAELVRTKAALDLVA